MAHNATIATKLGFAFSVILVIFASTSAGIAWMAGKLRSQAQAVSDFGLPRGRAAAELLDALQETRVANRDLLIASGAEQTASALKRLAEQRTRMKDALKAVRDTNDTMAPSEEERALFDRLASEFDDWFPYGQRVSELVQAGREREGLSVLTVETNPRMVKLLRSVKEYFLHISRSNGTRTQAVFADAASMVVGTLVAAVVAIVLAVLLGWRITVSITRPLHEAVRALERVASGDLTATIRVDSDNEIGRLQSATKTMIDSLSGTVREVSQGTTTLTSATEELTTAAREVKDQSEQQSEEVSAVAAALEQISTSIGHISDLSADAHSVSRSSGDSAASGHKTIERMVADMDHISASIQEAAATAQRLGAESATISSITRVIKEVADQTNLLALNAAIESARAGEHGRGFAVVADEVRSLAEKTTKSAEEISSMIVAIQASTEAMARQMAQTVERVSSGSELTSRAAVAMNEINSGAQRAVRLIDEVSLALKEQTSASHDIAARVERIVHIIEENSRATGSVSHAAHDLDSLAKTLLGTVSRFQVAA